MRRSKRPACQKVYPSPFHKGPFVGGLVVADAKVSQKKQTNDVIKKANQARNLVGEGPKGLHQQGAQNIKRQDKNSKVEDAGFSKTLIYHDAS
jgi:hypothetical protein